jgi:hypothetical protein
MRMGKLELIFARVDAGKAEMVDVDYVVDDFPGEAFGR